MLKSGSELRLRDLYLNRLIAFQDTEPVCEGAAAGEEARLSVL